MKKLTLIIGIIVAAFTVQAQNQQAYMQAMGKGLTAMGSAQSFEDYQKVAAQFERIAMNAKSEWHPSYYAALAYLNMSTRVEGISEKDQWTKKSQTFVDQAMEIAPNNSEVVALQGFQYMIVLAADPNSRGQMLSPKAMQYLGQALQMDPENPRANIFMAQMEFGMAQFFGSPTANSCERAQKAVDLFKSQANEQSIEPNWGADTAEEMVKQCSK